MSNKRNKRQKAKKPGIAKQQAAKARELKAQKQKAPPTANAKMIRDLMVATGVKGDYRDYVIIAGMRLVDWLGSYDIRSDEHLGSVGINGMALLHKSKLRNAIGGELASNFWDSKLKMRKQFGEHPNRPVRKRK